jgi:mono/diheme cytochrome c family protein
MLTYSVRIFAIAVSCLYCAAMTSAQSAKRPVKATGSAEIQRGKYLVTGIAGCADCHTPMNEKGEPVAGQWMKGAKLPFGPLVPFPAWADTAPDIAGLEGWENKKAVELLMTGKDPSGHPPRPPMPQYRMNPADAAAVVAYLKSLK